MKARSITTGVGDYGHTFLFSGEEVPKNSPRTDTYGDLDELVSVLGVARLHSRRREVRGAIAALQRKLFVAGAELATSEPHLHLLKRRVTASMVADIDRARTRLEAAIDMPDGFIVPGGSGSAGAAYLDHARTVARRLERKVVGLKMEGLLSNRHLLVWVNRLSDYLWLLARREEGSPALLRPRARRKK